MKKVFVIVIILLTKNTAYCNNDSIVLPLIGSIISSTVEYPVLSFCGAAIGVQQCYMSEENTKNFLNKVNFFVYKNRGHKIHSAQPSKRAIKIIQNASIFSGVAIGALSVGCIAKSIEMLGCYALVHYCER